MNRTALNAGLLVSALVLGSIAVWQLRREDAPVAAAQVRSDYVLREFELVTLHDDGTESFTVNGPYLQRDIGGRSLSLVQPRFSFPHADGRWRARAEAAWVSPKADEVHLVRDVELVGPPPADGSTPSTMRTARLVVLPESEEVRSDDLVTVTQGESILAGTGLRADMKTKRFQLLSQVKGRYEPR